MWVDGEETVKGCAKMEKVENERKEERMKANRLIVPR